MRLDIIDKNPPRSRWQRFRRAVRTSRRMRRAGYWQTWPVVNTFPPWLRWIVQKLCGARGHEFSRTEHGWDGGPRVDQWCRWCNTMLTIPRRESVWLDKWSHLLTSKPEE